jgi:hypothetical protein
MGTSLVEAVKSQERRPAVIDDCVALIDAEVRDKRGFTGVAVKAAFKTVKSVKPGMIGMAMDGLLDDFSAKIDPFWAECQEQGATPRSFFSDRRSAVANALLSITDDRASQSRHKVLVGAYRKLRGQAVQHIGDAMPRFADLIQKHAT